MVLKPVGVSVKAVLDQNPRWTDRRLPVEAWDGAEQLASSGARLTSRVQFRKGGYSWGSGPCEAAHWVAAAITWSSGRKKVGRSGKAAPWWVFQPCMGPSGEPLGRGWVNPCACFWFCPFAGIRLCAAASGN
jgi:hypothetical protein